MALAFRLAVALAIALLAFSEASSLHAQLTTEQKRYFHGRCVNACRHSPAWWSCVADCDVAMLTCFVTARDIDTCQAKVLKQEEQKNKEQGATKEVEKKTSAEETDKEFEKKAMDRPKSCANPGDGQTRVWYACVGKEFEQPTSDELALGVEVASTMCCTEEVSFECLCCMDFAQPLEFKRCGVASLNGAQKPKGSPGAMEVDGGVTDKEDAVIICTEERAVGRVATQHGAKVLPMDCINREFSMAELRGNSSVPPGQAIFDERIDFLLQQGLPASAIPTCSETVGGICPSGTPKAGDQPNSADKDLISSLRKESLLSSAISMQQKTLQADGGEARQDAESGIQSDPEILIRSHALFKKKAGLTQEEALNIPADSSESAGSFQMDFAFSDGKSFLKSSRRGGGGFLSTAGSFTLSSGDSSNVGSAF